MKKTLSLLVVSLALCLALSSCVQINSTIPAIALDEDGNVVTKADNSGYQVNYYNVNNGTTVLVNDPNEVQQTQAAQQPVTQQAVQQPTVETPATSAPDTAPAVQQGNVSLNTDEEKLNFFNTAVNKVKSQNAGFTKSKKTVGTEMQLSNSLVNAVASALKDSLLPNDTAVTTVNKGDSSRDIMSPPGKDYVSALTVADCKSITSEQSGNNYIITVSVADATNPDSENSAYAKIFEFITVDDIMDTYAPNMNATVERENVFFDFAGCYAKATIAADGTLLEYETFVSGTMRLTEGKIRAFTTDLSIVLSSTTQYKDFQW